MHEDEAGQDEIEDKRKLYVDSKVTSILLQTQESHFFLFGFSFRNIYDAQDSRRRGRLTL